MEQAKSAGRIYLATVLMTLAGALINRLIYKGTGNYLLILIISQLLLIIPSVFYLVKQRKGLAETIGFRSISVGSIVLVIIFAYLIMPLMGLINAISMLFVNNDTTQVISNLVGKNGFLVSLVMVALVPCLMEESVYRGVLFQSYRQTSTLKGIFLSGFLFGLIHQNFNQFSYAFVMGVVFVLVIEATGSILSTMIIHFIINSSSVMSLALQSRINGLAGTEAIVDSAQKVDLGTTIIYMIPIAAISTLLAFFVFRVLADNSGRWEHVKGIFKERTKTHFLTPSLIIGMVICLIIMIIVEYQGRFSTGISKDEGFVTVIYGIIHGVQNFFY